MFGHYFSSKDDKNNKPEVENKEEKKPAKQEVKKEKTDFSALDKKPLALQLKHVKGLGKDYLDDHPKDKASRRHGNHDVAEKLFECSETEATAGQLWKIVFKALRDLDDRGSHGVLFNSIVNVVTLAFDLKNRPELFKDQKEVVNRLESEFRGRFFDSYAEAYKDLKAEFETYKKNHPSQASRVKAYASHTAAFKHADTAAAADQNKEAANTAPRP